MPCIRRRSPMTRRARLLSSCGVLSFVLLVLAACGGEVEGGGGGGPCTEYVNALMAYAERCDTHPMSSQPHLRPRLEAACARSAAAPGVTNLAVQLSACAHQISAASCKNLNELACDLTGGTLDDDTPCGQGYQCKSGACKQEPGATCGTCAPRVPIGGACSRPLLCVDGADCVNDQNHRGTCVPVRMAGAGEKCGPSPAESVRCETGLLCLFAGGESVCTAPGGAGAACLSSNDCEGDLTCVGGKCGPALGEGAACHSSECGKGLACSVDSKCARIITVKAGEPCDRVRRCERGACEGLTYPAGSRPGEIRIVPGRCVDPLPDGAACSKGEGGPPCDYSAECIDGVCTPSDPARCK